MKVITISGKDKKEKDDFINSVKAYYGGIVHKLLDTNIVDNTINLINKSDKKKTLLSELENICKDFNEIIITEMFSFIDSKKGKELIFIDTNDKYKIQLFKNKYHNFSSITIDDNYNDVLKSFLSTLT